MRDPCEVAFNLTGWECHLFQKIWGEDLNSARKKIKIFVVGNFTIFTVFFWGPNKSLREHERFHGDFSRGFCLPS